MIWRDPEMIQKESSIKAQFQGVLSLNIRYERED